MIVCSQDWKPGRRVPMGYVSTIVYALPDGHYKLRKGEKYWDDTKRGWSATDETASLLTKVRLTEICRFYRLEPGIAVIATKAIPENLDILDDLKIAQA
jgi:hypothetical protein